jgi:D-aminoacyl-tRNA deacylase
MIGLLQRVTSASVEVGGERVAQIGTGLLVLVGVERDDDAARAQRLLARLLGYRVFEDAEGRMNRSVADVQGGLLLVPQFTLAADTRRGSRPGFSTAAPPGMARTLFAELLDQARQHHPTVAAGRFGANMQVQLTNDGPVTFWLTA